MAKIVTGFSQNDLNMSFCLQVFSRLLLQGRWAGGGGGEGSCIKKKKKKKKKKKTIDSIRSKDYDLCILISFIRSSVQALLGICRDTGYLGKKLIECKKFRGNINGVEDV